MSDTPIFDGLKDRDTPIYENTAKSAAESPENNETPNRWIASKSARLWLYGVAVAVAALLVGYGILTVEHGGLWLSVVGALLGLGNAVAGRNVPKG